MKTVIELKKEQTRLVNAQSKIVETAEAEKRSLTAEETTEFDGLQTQIVEIRAELSRAEQFEENKRVTAEARAINVVGDGDGDGEEKEKNKVVSRFSITKMLRNATEGTPLTGAEKEANDIAIAENEAAGVKSFDSKRGIRVMVPVRYFRGQQRATQQTVTQDSGNYGGELVNDSVRLVAGLEPKLFIEEMGAQVLTGLSGGNIKMPVSGSYDFSWLAEGANITVAKKTITGPVLSPKRAGASVSLTNQLLMQSSIDVDAMVKKNLTAGWAKLLNGAAINGAGGSEPTGILNKAGVNDAGGSANLAATFAKIVELQGLIEEDDATDISLGYLVHPKLKAALKTKTLDAGSGRFILENNAIDGEKFVSSSLMPVGDDGGTAIYPTIYGDFSQLFVGQWGAVSILVNPYSEDLADSVRLTLNTHADVQIANAAAFAKNSWFNGA